MPATPGLGERIRRLRLAHNLTLRQVEREAKVSATHLSEIERGKTSPTVGALLRIARALGEDAARLIDDDAPPLARVVRNSGRREFSQAGVVFQPLAPPIASADLSLFEAALPDGGEAMPAPAGAREVLVLVLRGEAELTLSSSRIILKGGDACHVAAGDWQGLRATTESGARVLLAASPRVCF